MFTIYNRTWKRPRRPSTDEWIKNSCYICNGLLLSHKKNDIGSPVVMRLNLKFVLLSKSEREKQISYINAYIWNLQKWHRGTYLQGWNRDADVEDGLWTQQGKGKGWTERAALACAHSHVLHRWPVGSCRVAQGLSRVLCDDLAQWVGRGRREAQEGRHICICIVDSFHCTAHTNTAL